ncbi:MAG: toll/interleukin-1 receptor domain-containing protein [Lachnospiraceae bacterium]|nr:toll/interleukin-1 receptor domain-containing protein [Lachnospiraceae bacterium]
MFEPNRFKLHVDMLREPEDRTKIVGLQQIFLGLEAGIIPSYAQRQTIEREIIIIISTNRDSRVRRWAYMIGAFCHNKNLVKLSKYKLPYEKDMENRTWIMAILATNLSEREFDDAVRHLDHGLSIEEIKIATYLFQKDEHYQLRKSDINKIIGDNNRLGMFWIGSNAGYNSLAVKRHKEIIVSNDIISELTRHDDDEVLKHLMYAYACQGTGSLNVEKDIKFDISKFASMSPHHKKWFLTAIWQDWKFIKNNQDYIRQILDMRHLKSCDERIREGIARGISQYCYDTFLVRPIEEWCSYEEKESVRYFLMRYVTKWSDCNTIYYQIAWNEEHLEGERRANIVKSFYQFDYNKKLFSTEREDFVMQSKEPKVFISHSSEDIQYVNIFVQLLQDIGLRKEHIFCSSVPGYDVPEGYDIYDYLREQFNTYDLHIFYVLSDNYYKSPACLNEMGAAWILQSRYTTILLPGFKFVSIKGAINPNKASTKLDRDIYEVKDKLGQIKDNLIKEFGLYDYSGTIWEKRRDRFIEEVEQVSAL